MDTLNDQSTFRALYPRAVAVGRRPSKTKLLVLLVNFGLGALGGAALAAFVASRGVEHGLAWLGVSLALFLVSMWVQVIVHEAGHAAAGVLTGRRLVGAGVGALRLERGTGGWHVRWAGGVRGIGGFAALLPVDGRGESRREEALFLLGGPLANFLVALAAYVTLRLVEPGDMLASFLLGSLAFSGTLLGVINLLPFQSHGWRSDGRGLLDLWRDRPEARIARMQQRVVSLSMAGLRPREWPEALLELPEGLPSDVALSAHALRLSRAIDAGETCEAERCAHALAALYPEAPDGRRQGVALMLAIYAVEVVRDPALLAAWRPLCEGGLLDLSAYRLWLDAEAAVFAGDAPAAAALTGRARAAVARVHDPGSAVVLQERLDRVQARLPRASEPQLP